ncbi:MAG: tetratricopeptide repeat protein [Planctomycetota bacterium]|jgi:TolA-binding protein
MLRFLLAAAWCLVVSAPAALGQQPAADAAVLRDYFAGNGLLNRGMYDLAAAEYRTFLEVHPDHAKAPLARYGLGVCLYRLGEHREAVDVLSALDKAPGFEFAVEVLMIRGQCELALDRPQEAAAAFGGVIRDHSAHGLADEAAALQAESYFEAGRFDMVDRPCTLLASRWPDSPHRQRAELFGGLAEMARGDYESAAARFEAMSAREQGGAYAGRVALLHAQCLHRTGAAARAADGYRRIVQQGPDEYRADAMYGLAVIEHAGGRLDGAGRLLDQLLQRYPDHDIKTAARVMRARVWLDETRYDRALEQLEPLTRKAGPYRDDAEYWSAKCILRKGQAAEAARRLKRAVERYPESDLRPQMTYDRAVALLRAGDHDEALEVLDDFRRRHGDHELAAEALHLTAAALHQERRYRESLVQCRAFEQQYADHELAPDVAFLAAENLFLLKQHADAAGAYRLLVQQHPDHRLARQARYRHGLSLYHQGSFDDAKPLLASVTDGRSTQPEFRAALLALGDGHFQQGNWQAAAENLGDYVAFGLDQPSADDALLKLGLAQQRGGDAPSALGTLNTLIEEFPESPHRTHAQFECGQILVELERPDEAAAAFEQVLAGGAETPFAGHAWNHLGAIALEQNHHTDAAAHFGRAADALAGDPAAVAEARFQQGQALMTAREYEAAAAAFDRIRREHRTYGELNKALALGAIAVARQDREGNHERALAAIREVENRGLRDLDPQLRAALAYEMAWALRGLGRTDEAARAYRSMLADVEQWQDLHAHAALELAEIEIEADRHQQAADLLRILQAAADDDQQLVPPDVRRQCAYRLGLCEYHLGNVEQASQLLEAYLADEPEGKLIPSARLLCAEAHYRAGRHQQAIEHLTRVVEDFPADEAGGPALLRLGECHAALQYWQRSREAFAAFLERHAESPMWFQAQFGIGWALENEGRFDEAIEAYGAVVKRHQGPTAARAQFQIGECLFARKQYEEAARELLKVDILYAYPEWSAAALYEAGRCFQEMGDPVDARRQFTQVREQYPDTRWATLAGERLGELAETSLPGH